MSFLPWSSGLFYCRTSVLIWIELPFKDKWLREYLYVLRLTRGLCWLLHSDPPLVFHYDSGPYSDFLAKILDVITQLAKQSFIFYFSHCYVLSLVREDSFQLSVLVQLVAYLFVVRRSQVWLVMMCVMALETVKCHLFSFYFPFTDIREWKECIWFLNMK